jgi:chromosomal replication initiation ATPase DnaA
MVAQYREVKVTEYVKVSLENRVPFERVLIEFCVIAECELSELIGKCRGNHIKFKRHLIIDFLNLHSHPFGYSYFIANQTEVGVLFGRDHATVNHSSKTVKHLCQTDHLFKVQRDIYWSKLKDKLNIK